MEEKAGMRESSEIRESAEADAGGGSQTAEDRRGPTWRGWVLSILVAVILSVMATLLLGGSGAFRTDRSAATGSAGSGYDGSCCPPSIAGK